MKPNYLLIETFETTTKLVAQATLDGRISYHVITTIKDKNQNDLEVLKGYAHIARIEILSHATGINIMDKIKHNEEQNQKEQEVYE